MDLFVCVDSSFLEFATTFGLLCVPASKQHFLSLHSFPAFASLLIPTQIKLLANAETCRWSSASIHIDLTNVASVVFVVIEPALGPCVCICDIY